MILKWRRIIAYCVGRKLSNGSIVVKQTLNTLLSQFKHREVRDLAWVIASPPLVSGKLDDVHWWSYEDCLSEFDDCLTELKKLDLNPTPLIHHLSELQNRRLGSIFEGFISFWLEISPNFRELQKNIQIIEDKHTYGEIDYIIENTKTDEVIHLEVAVKFYLGCTPYEDAYRWFGTNTKDQLGKKIDHLKSHQTQLSTKYPSQLKNYFDRKIDKKQCFIKGRLFYPENSNTSPQNIELAKDHLRGRWCYVAERNKTVDAIKVNKSHWLAELNSADITDMAFASIESINTIDRAECYVETNKNNADSFEEERVFYLPSAFSFPKNDRT